MAFISAQMVAAFPIRSPLGDGRYYMVSDVYKKTKGISFLIIEHNLLFQKPYILVDIRNFTPEMNKLGNVLMQYLFF